MAADAGPVGWFEIPVHDLGRAKAFYEHILGIEMALFEPGPFRMAWFPSAEEATRPSGALMEAARYVPSHEGTMIYFAVEDIDAVLVRVRDADGKVLAEKMSIGEHGFVGHFEDSEGNRVGLRSDR